MEDRSTKDIMSLYMEGVLNGHSSENVYQFCKRNEIEENEFYQEYSSFEYLKTTIYSKFVSETVRLISESEDYASLSTREQLLSFYYTFFELLTANRTYVVLTLKENKEKLDTLKSLNGLRTEFKKYIETLSIDKMSIPQELLNSFKDKAIGEVAVLQLVFTLKFWLNDTSSGFEKTDSLIEKSVKASFEIVDSLPSESIFDLGKFLFKEKFGSL